MMGQDRSWWADTLDPVESLRTLTDAQAFGRRAAEDLADRLLGRGDAVDPSAAGSQPAGSQPAGSQPAGSRPADLAERVRADAVRAGEAAIRLAEDLMSLIAVLVERVPTPARADGAGGPVTLTPVYPGGESTGMVWIHNDSPAAVAAVRPHCGAPRSHLGRELGPDAVRFDPPILDPLPPRSTCGIEVSVRVPPDTEPGTYVSVVLAANLSELYLPIHVLVESAGGAE
jgi:hypothetical protein